MRRHRYRIDTFIGAPPPGRLTTMPTGRGVVLVVGVMLSHWATRAMIRARFAWGENTGWVDWWRWRGI